MAIRKKSEILPTLKIAPKKGEENAVKFKDCQAEIVEISTLDTKHGEKALAKVLIDGKNLNVFMNQTSINNMIEAHGEDDIKWVGQIVDLKKETNAYFDAENIVFHAVK